MKRVYQHPPEAAEGKRYWRGADELSDTPQFRAWLEREFPDGASELDDNDWSRRGFLKLMGASMALAGFGLSSCRRPEAHLVPFTKSAEWTIPGKALYYATAMPRRNGALPLVATTVDGRPIKLEGNPLHPASGGASDAFAQASILDLYDPTRSRTFLKDGKPADRVHLTPTSISCGASYPPMVERDSHFWSRKCTRRHASGCALNWNGCSRRCAGAFTTQPGPMRSGLPPRLRLARTPGSPRDSIARTLFSHLIAILWIAVMATSRVRAPSLRAGE